LALIEPKKCFKLRKTLTSTEERIEKAGIDIQAWELENNIKGMISDFPAYLT